MVRAPTDRSALGTRQAGSEIREQLTSEFAELLLAEGRASIVDFGAGPGLDLASFSDAGIVGVGLDLAVRNAGRATEWPVVVVPGSITAAPFSDQSFDAGWSMSTLMHLESEAMAEAAVELCRVLRPGAPARIGLWGSETAGTQIDNTTIAGHQRPFHHRSADENASIIHSAFGSIAGFCVLDIEDSISDYQIFDVRAPAPGGRGR